MKIFVSLIPAVAYALVTFFSNIAGLTSEAPKSSEKKLVVSQPALQKETDMQKNFVWIPNNAKNIATSEDSDASQVWKLSTPPAEQNFHSYLLIRRNIHSQHTIN